MNNKRYFRHSVIYQGVDYTQFCDIAKQLGITNQEAREFFEKVRETRFQPRHYKEISRADQLARWQEQGLSDEEIIDLLVTCYPVDYYFTAEGFYKFLCEWYVRSDRPGLIPIPEEFRLPDAEDSTVVWLRDGNVVKKVELTDQGTGTISTHE